MSLLKMVTADCRKRVLDIQNQGSRETHTTTQAYILTLAWMLVAGEVTWQQGTNKLQRREDVGWEGHKGLHKTNRDTVLSNAFMKLQIK